MEERGSSGTGRWKEEIGVGRGGGSRGVAVGGKDGSSGGRRRRKEKVAM